MDRKDSFLRVLLLSLVMAGSFILSSCEQYSWAKEEVPEDLIVSYSQHIYPFCHGCHSSWDIDKTYDNLYAHVDTVTPSSSEVLSIHSSNPAFGSAMIMVDTVLISAPDMIMLWASQGAQYN